MDALSAPEEKLKQLVIPVRLVGEPGISYKNTPVSLGIPFARGAVVSLDNLELTDNGEVVPHQLTETATWPDGSIRWALLEFHASLPASSQSDKQEKIVNLSTIELDKRQNRNAPLKNIEVTINSGKDELQIATDNCSYSLNRDAISCFRIQDPSNSLNNSSYQLSLTLIDQNDNEIQAESESCEILYGENSQAASIKYSGRFYFKEKKSSIKFELTATFYAQNSAIKFALLVRNEQAAKHPKGLWDLGDEGSIFFKHLGLNFTELDSLSSSVIWKASAAKKWSNATPNRLSIYQESSAGENWRSATHKNNLGDIPIQIKGAVVQSDAERNIIETRLSPHVYRASDNPEHGTSVYIKNFWQNFPSAIEADQQGFSIQFFPKRFPDSFELQGGEQKNQEAYIDFASKRNALDWVEHPIRATLPREYYATTGAVLYLATRDSEQCSPLLDLIRAGIEGSSNFFGKREVIDEYGWRNFGDLYADHENAYNKESTPIISHYNNQYDPVMGFALQYMMTGRDEYFSLMDDLARHVIDIDIYHTDRDRAEYSHGLFWHTDHYLDACTATHRTFSKDHNPESYWDYQKGGGPGDEHCYTTGLLYHYWLTGNRQSRDALLELGNWIPVFHGGSGTVLERMRKFFARDIKTLRQVLRGSPQPMRYHPLTRATGNLLNTLIDLFLLESNKVHLDRCAEIIENTIHPEDDIEQRGLLDIENNWSYTVFLQSLIRFLTVKKINGFFDHSYFYTKACLTNYALWMAENEKPYLSSSNKLEHPNHTWTAQDLRKVDILINAAIFIEDANASQLIEKSKELFDSSLQALKNTEEKRYTRIIVLTMQSYSSMNHGFWNTSLAQPPLATSNECIEAAFQMPSRKYFSVSNILGRFLRDLFQALRNFSPRKEYLWIKRRLD